MDRREVASSESRYYVMISGKGMAIFLDLGNKNPNKKQKSSIASTDITNQYFRKFLKEFKNSTDLGNKNKQFRN